MPRARSAMQEKKEAADSDKDESITATTDSEDSDSTSESEQNDFNESLIRSSMSVLLAQAATLVRALTSEFCPVDWALLPLSTRK